MHLYPVHFDERVPADKVLTEISHNILTNMTCLQRLSFVVTYHTAGKINVL